MKTESLKTVVIIGGGFAGALVAKILQSKFRVVLIDTKDYYEFTPSILRTIVEPEHIGKIQIKHSSYLPEVQIVVEEVIDVTERVVKTKQNQYNYDYLVIASGSRYNSPIKEKNVVLATRAQELKQYAEKLEKSSKILII